MKYFIGQLNLLQQAKLLVALYDNVAIARRFSPLKEALATEYLVERQQKIVHLGQIYIGVNFSTKDGYIDLTQYNARLKSFEGVSQPGEAVVKAVLEGIGLAGIKPKSKEPSLTDAISAPQKTFLISAGSKKVEEKAVEAPKLLPAGIKSTLALPSGC